MPPQAADRRHLLRRLAFAATPDLERSMQARTAADALDLLIKAARQAPQPETPGPAKEPWVNRALRLTTTSNTQLNALNAEVSKSNLRDTELLRQWWLSEMIATPVPLRENLVLFFHSVLGGSYRAIDGPQALYGYNALLRRHALGTIPDLLEALVLDPGMMMQESYDETRKELPSDFSARQILSLWTVGAGNYSDDDADGLARALTGWILEAAPGEQPNQAIDPRGFRNNRRTGMVPTFHADLFDDRPKTIFASTKNFGAREAVRFLALQPATALRYGKSLVQYFGVHDPAQRLTGQLADKYQSTSGSVEALLRTMVLAPEFWSKETRWNLIKSPVHLAVGACRSLELQTIPAGSISAWLAASGQKLLDAPNFGGESWPGQQAWLEPAERLAARYELGTALFGGNSPWGLGTQKAPEHVSALPDHLRAEKAATILNRLDPAPGLTVPESDAQKTIHHILATPEYQLA